MSDIRKDDGDPAAKVVGVLVFAGILIFLVWLLWLHHVTGVVRETLLPAAAAASAPTQSDVLQQLGQAGDAFGSLNALFAGLAAALVAAAAYLQNQQLQQARTAYEAERRSRVKLEFEATFFQMLGISRDVASRIEARFVRQSSGVSQDPEKQGPAAIDFLASGVSKLAGKWFDQFPREQASWIVNIYGQCVYAKQPSTLGPYFRILFQLFKVIDESELDETAKVRYANIVRGQMSEGAVFLLALNGLTARGFKFVYYIEKFGLLEHMHDTYERNFKQALLVGYRLRAFLGSKKRVDHPLESVPLMRAGEIEFTDMRRYVRRKFIGTHSLPDDGLEEHRFSD